MSTLPSRFRFDDAGYAAILRVSSDTPRGEVAAHVHLRCADDRVAVLFYGPDRLRGREIRTLLVDEPARLVFLDPKGARIEITPITLEWWRAHGKAAAMSAFEPGGDTPTDLEKLRAYVANGGAPT